MQTDKKSSCNGLCCKKNEEATIDQITQYGQLQPSMMKCDCAK